MTLDRAGTVDVAIPSYGYGRFLVQCVRSVLEQHADLRVLILDDCSPDDTPQVAMALAAADPRVAYVRHDTNRGHIATYNEGIEWAAGDCMLLLSADDYLLPGALERAMAMMEAHPEMSLCVGQARVLYADGRSREVRVDPGQSQRGDRVLSGAQFLALLLDAGANNTVVSATAVVRTRWLRELGGYRVDMPHCGDLELWMRLAAHGTVGLVDQPQAVYRRHSANMSDRYARDYGMADLQQRRHAFEVFVCHAAGLMPEAGRMYRRLLKSLAREAIGQASAAFSDGATEMSRRLHHFGLETSPAARFSSPRLRLLVKQALGLRGSRALMRALARWRARREHATASVRADAPVEAAGPLQEP